jgi:hypothetical protein
MRDQLTYDGTETADQKLQQVFDLCRLADDLVLARLRSEHPQADDEMIYEMMTRQYERRCPLAASEGRLRPLGATAA